MRMKYKSDEVKRKENWGVERTREMKKNEVRTEKEERRGNCKKKYEEEIKSEEKKMKRETTTEKKRE